MRKKIQKPSVNKNKKKVTMISLSSFTYLVAEKDMPCDAFKIWCDVAKSLDAKEKQKGISTWFNARHGILLGSG